MSQSDVDYQSNSQRYGGGLRQANNDDIGPGFFGGAKSGNVFNIGSGAGTVQLENEGRGGDSYSYSEF
jgi:hypothetical protein